MEASDVEVGGTVCACDLKHHKVAAVRADQDILVTTTGIEFSISHCVRAVEDDGSCHDLDPIPD